MVGRAGLEPTTPSSSGLRSTNWATDPFVRDNDGGGVVDSYSLIINPYVSDFTPAGTVNAVQSLLSCQQDKMLFTSAISLLVFAAGNAPESPDFSSSVLTPYTTRTIMKV